MTTAVPLERTPKASSHPTDMQRRFHGQVALITGASDKGIGGAIAERFVREGAHVAMISRHEPAQLMQKLAKLDAAHATFMEGDITRPEDIQRLVAGCMHDHGRIDF